MSRISMGRVGALLSRRCKHLQRKSQQRNYRKLFLHRPGMEGLEPRLMLASDLLVADAVSDSILRFTGGTGAPLGAFVTSGSGGLVDPLDPEFGPDGNLYVISNNPGQVKVLRYNGSTGAPLDTFVDLGAGSASAIEFGPDGNLYLATLSETGVLRFNGATGQPMGVAASGNGIRRASGIDFGPDGRLYVLDSDRVIDVSADRVLRFDPSNGAFIDQFVAPGQLNDSVFLTFGPDNQLYVPDIQVFHDVRRFSGTTGEFFGVFANSPDPANNPIFDIQFGPDGNAYAATGKDILQLDGETGRLLDTFVAGTGGSITFFPPLGPAIDLSVSSIDVPVGVVQGNDLSITYSVTNNSASTTSVSSWDDVVYLSTDDVFDPTDVELGRIARILSLTGGASYTETLTAPLPNVSLGDYYVFVFADRRGAVNDTARLNNLRLATNTLEVFPPLASSHDPDHSIVVGRTLSAYTTADVTNNELTITYTVYNLTDGYTRETLLTTTLDPNVALVHASLLPDQNGQNLAWSLGTISPFGRASVEITVSLASLLATQVDTGSRAFATIDTFAVTDAAPSAKLRADVIETLLLASTPDANATDPFIQSKAAELEYDPQRIFDYLTDDVVYESYVGSLRGARGTLWSAAGNSLDEASLGVALFRASGIPARYAGGTLPDALARQLIVSMFPPGFQTVGYIPAGTNLADPANDLRLLVETREHYWVQFDDGFGFRDADSVFAAAQIGQTFTASTGGFAEVPDSLRHKVNVRLDVESYSPAGALFGFGDGLSRVTVLDQTINDVELVGRPLSIRNFVRTTQLPGLVFSARTTTYSPYIQVGDLGLPDASQDEILRGTDVQEVLTNFPLGSQVVTGAFLSMEVRSPDGSTESHERALLDRIGFAARQGGTGFNIAFDPDGPAAFSEFDALTLFVSPSRQDRAVRSPLVAEIVDTQARLTPFLAGLTPENSKESGDLARAVTVGFTRMRGIDYLLNADPFDQRLASAAMVAAYYDSPRLVLVGSRQVLGPDPLVAEVQEYIDLRRNTIRAIAAPGQDVDATRTFLMTRGIIANLVEDAVQKAASDAQEESVQTVSVTPQSSTEQLRDRQPVFVTGDNLASLDALAISAEAKARITLAVGRGLGVVVPTQSVVINGKEEIAWYELDPKTGELIDVAEDGGHITTIEYAAVLTVYTGFSAGGSWQSP